MIARTNLLWKLWFEEETDSEINVVPYIDVCWFVDCIHGYRPMLNQGIEVDLPQANNEPLDLNENLETLIVSITASGEYFLSIGAMEEVEVVEFGYNWFEG